MENKDKIIYQKEIFKNRLLKNYRKLKTWAGRNRIFCYRVYDRDIPELPFVLDLYSSVEDVLYLSFALYRRPYEKDEDEEDRCVYEMSLIACDVLGVKQNNLFVKMRERKRGLLQYEKVASSKTVCFVVKEGNALFNINISDYIDTGLFLDHRPLRLEIAKTSFGKDVLNLFSYTASFSVHAILNGARSVCSVDFSNTAIKRAKENCVLNGIAVGSSFTLKRDEVRNFLTCAVKSKKKWDIIICDPPTFSNSSSDDWDGDFDISKCCLDLCLKSLMLLKYRGVLYFSTNSRRLKFESELLKKSVDFPIFIKDISATSIPLDFRNKKIHKTWKIIREG